MIEVRVIKDFRIGILKMSYPRSIQAQYSTWQVLGQVRCFEMITGMLDGAEITFRNTARLREVENRAVAFVNSDVLQCSTV